MGEGCWSPRVCRHRSNRVGERRRTVAARLYRSKECAQGDVNARRPCHGNILKLIVAPNNLQCPDVVLEAKINGNAQRVPHVADLAKSDTSLVSCGAQRSRSCCSPSNMFALTLSSKSPRPNGKSRRRTEPATTPPKKVMRAHAGKQLCPSMRTLEERFGARDTGRGVGTERPPEQPERCDHGPSDCTQMFHSRMRVVSKAARE